MLDNNSLITGKGLRKVAQMNGLEWLSLARCDFDDEDAKILSRMSSICGINFSENKAITTNGLNYLLEGEGQLGMRIRMSGCAFAGLPGALERQLQRRFVKLISTQSDNLQKEIIEGSWNKLD